MDDGHMHGVGGMAPPTPPMSAMRDHDHQHHHHTMMHMTFFWGKNAEILFSGWPGSRSGMYALALILVFVLSIVIEWLSHCKLIRDASNHISAGLIQTLMHGLRIAMAYTVMLAVMSFNVGVFLAAIAGHTLGFLFFGSRAFNKSPPPPSGKASDLPPLSC